MMGGYGGAWWIVMWIAMAAFWLLVLGAVAWLVLRATQSRSATSSATDILKQRLAHGEIDVEQYRTLSQALNEAPQAGSRRGSASGGHVLLLVAVALGIVLLAAPAIAIAAKWGDWDMMNHMGSMMGGGSNTANAPLTIGGDSETVTISGLAFSPGNLQVPVGATVTWMNRDSVSHNATSRDGSWKTENLSNGESGEMTFDHPGEYDYYCSIHPSMKAHLTVK